MGKYLPILTIARCGSFNKAAGELGYSQPNLWHIVNNLEDELGAKLFHRSRQGVTLTDAGEVLLERMARIEAQESSLFQTAQTFQRNQIRLGLCPGLSAAWVAALLSTLKATAPDLHVKLETPETYRDGLTAVADQGLDLCFSVLPGSPDVEAVTLWEEPFVLAAGADHPLARLDRVSLADVVGKVPLIPWGDCFDSDSPLWPLYRRTEHVFLADSMALDTGVALALAERGLGVALLPKTAMEGPSGAVRCIPLIDGPSRSVTLLRGEEEDRSPLAEEVISLTLRLAEEQQNDAFACQARKPH